MADERARSRRWWWRIVAVIGVTAAFLAPAVSGPPTAQADDGPSRRLVQRATRIRLPGPWPGIVSAPQDVAVTADAVWVLQPRAGEVDRIDPATNRVVARIKLRAPECLGPPLRECGMDRITADTRNVWATFSAARGAPGRLVHIDARTNRLLGSVRFTSPVLSPPVIDGDSVWTTLDPASGDIVRIDAETHAPTATVHIGTAPVAPIAVVDGMVWASTVIDGLPRQIPETLYRVDPSTGEVVATVAAVGGLPAVVVDGDVWLARLHSPEIVRIDGRTGEIEQSVTVDGATWYLGAGGGAVWVQVNNAKGFNDFRKSMTRIDASTGSAQSYELPTSELGAGLAFGHGSIWLADWTAGSLHRARARDL